MTLLRRRLRLAAAAWILFQAATLSALVPRACCLAHDSAKPSSNCHDKAIPHCPMAGDDGGPCAMHQAHMHGHADHAAADAQVPADECALRGTCGGPAAALFALLSTHGVLTDPYLTLAESPLVGATLPSATQLIRRFASPDAPPPRA
jgi:hypothetical protein